MNGYIQIKITNHFGWRFSFIWPRRDFRFFLCTISDNGDNGQSTASLRLEWKNIKNHYRFCLHLFASFSSFAFFSSFWKNISVDWSKFGSANLNFLSENNNSQYSKKNCIENQQNKTSWKCQKTRLAASKRACFWTNFCHILMVMLMMLMMMIIFQSFQNDPKKLKYRC